MARYLSGMAIFNPTGGGAQSRVFSLYILGPVLSTTSQNGSGDSLTKFL